MFDVRRARQLLFVNAIFTAACAVPMVVATPVLSETLIGPRDGSAWLAVIGVMLLGYAVLLLVARARPGPGLRRWLMLFASADIAWTLATVLLALVAPMALTSVGWIAAAGVGLVVGALGLAQWRLAAASLTRPRL